MTSDSESRFSFRHVAILIGAIALLIVPTGAAMVNSGMVDFLGEDSGLALSAADGPNGEYVEFDAEDQLSVNISTDGVNLDSATTFDRVFIINNTGDEPREVWINHTNSDILSLYDTDTKRPIGFDDRITLAPGERIYVGISVDLQGEDATVGQSIEAVLTIHSRDLTPDDGPKVGLPDRVDFGDVTSGTIATRTVTISNDGGAPMALNGVSISGQDASTFSLAGAGGLPNTIEPGESVEITVEAFPDRTGSLSASLVVDTNATATPATVPISAVGAATDLTVVGGADLGFGEVEIETALERTITLRNDGSTTVEITDTQIAGSDAGSFRVVEAGVLGDIAPGETVTVPVKFTPTRTGAHEATLDVGTAGANPVAATIDLAGTGIIPADIAVEPTIIDFGDVGLNGHANDTLTITNEGQRPLNLDTLRIRGGDADQFSLRSSLDGTTLGPDESTTVTVDFDPARAGELAAELQITSDDPDTPVRSVPLTGVSLRADIGHEPEDLDFGNVTPGSSKTLEIDVWNEEDSIADLRVTSTAILGSNPEAFEVTRNKAPFTLSPGEERTIEVTYSPDTTGIKTAQLRILSNGDEQQIDVWMSNTGWRIRVQEVPSGGRSVDAEEEDFNLDTNRVRDTSTNVEVDANDIPENVDIRLNVSSPGTRDRPAGMEEVAFRTRVKGTFDMNFVHDDAPPLSVSPTYNPASGEEIAQYVSLWHSIDTDSFEGPELVYQVRKVNLDPGTNPEQITFRRFQDGEWVSYETELLRETPNTYVFRVLDLPGFSEFVITGPNIEPDDGGNGGAGGGGGGGGPVPPGDEEETPPDETQTTPDEDDDREDGEVRVNFDGEPSEEGITITELDTIPGSATDEGPLAVIDQFTGNDGDATARIGTAERTAEVQERIEAAGADAMIEVGQSIQLTGSPSVIRSANGVDGRGQIVRAVDITVPESQRNRPATIELTVDRERFGGTDPGRALIGHWTGTGWQILSTTIVDSGAETATVRARTPGFSPFAVFADNQVRFTWELPDGRTVEGQTIDPTFEEPGRHNVTLTVTDAFGRSDSATYRILANDRPSVEIVAPETIEPGENVSLRADVENEVGDVTATWQFSDGTEATGLNVTKRFEAGNRDVRVVVTDEFGSSSEAAQTLPVGPTFGAQQLRSMATNMPFEAQVLLSFLLAVTLTFAATRLSGAGTGGWLAGLRLPVLPFRRSHPPEILTFAEARLDRVGGRFVVGRLTVRDSNEDLDLISLEVRNGRGTIVARRMLEPEEDEEYSASDVPVPALSRVYLVDEEEFEITLIALDARGDEARMSLPVKGGR